eukprot:augustus_masked-scaffold_8-processed-gene-12.0-mRNA-1 protein AED:1.00 eAED:1.00 QI:0/-1/0/1/-1/1/1/0/311
MPTEDELWCGSICCGVTTILFIIFIATSLIKVQFDEYAFKKPWGQGIDQSEVYTQGVYFLGFWNSMVTFPATVIKLELDALSVFSSATEDDAGTTLVLDVVIEYTLDPNQLSELFDIGGETGYIKQIEAVAIEEVKNTATNFNADSYLTNRRNIETSFEEVLEVAIRESFAGTQVQNVKLVSVLFPDTFYQRKLDVGLQEINNEIQQFNQDTALVRDETARQVLEIENEAREITETASAEAALIVTKAENERTRLIGDANQESIKILADNLGITEQADFLSLNYLVQLLTNPGNQRKFVNFGQTPEARSLL